MKHLAFLSLLMSLCLAACGSTSEGGGSSGDPNSSSGSGLCGTNATTITYSGQAAAVLNASCVSCHSPSGVQPSTPLDTYAHASATLTQNNGSAQTDAGSMPPSTSGQLSANQTCIIHQWAAGGYPQ